MKANLVAFASILAMSLAKNVVAAPQLNDDAFKAFNLEVDLTKREAKNVFNLLDKREAKNVVNIAAIEDAGFDFRKRDAKNVVDLNLQIEDASLQKREGKNVIDLNLMPTLDERMKKRDAKNVVNLNLAIDDGLYKRDACHMKVKMKEMQLSNDQIEHLDNLNVVIGDKTFEVDQKYQDDNEITITLKPWTEKIASFIYDLSPLTTFLDSFQAKAKTYLDSNTLSGETIVVPPLDVDLISALIVNEKSSLFSSYLRDLTDLYTRCETIADDEKADIQSEESTKKLLMLAPLDEAIYQLSKKPWQFPNSLDSVHDDETKQDEIIASNVRHFVESHMVETDNIVFDSSNNKMVELKTLNGRAIYLKNDGSKGFWVHSDNDDDDWVLVQSIHVVKNGALLSIPSSLSHP